MARAIYIGGFGNGRSSAEGVGNALGTYFEQPEAFTFSDLVKDPSKIRKAGKGAVLFTHSAGALAIEDTEINPEYAYLMNPPLPKSIGGLALGTLVKTGRMLVPGTGVHEVSDIGAVIGYNVSAVAELATHPIANFGSLGKISNFHAVDSAIKAKGRGVPTELSWTTHDAYYHPHHFDYIDSQAADIPIRILPGEHDEIALRPETHLKNLLEVS